MKLHPWLGRLALFGAVATVCGCPPSGTPTGTQTSSTAAEDSPAVKEAKAKFDTSTLAPGEEKEFVTANGTVIVSKDAAGKVSYKQK